MKTYNSKIRAKNKKISIVILAVEAIVKETLIELRNIRVIHWHQANLSLLKVKKNLPEVIFTIKTYEKKVEKNLRKIKFSFNLDFLLI